MSVELLTTDIKRTKAKRERFYEIKRSLITEAILLPIGTNNERIKTTINTINGNEAAFYKPGKESMRKIPNKFDMYPAVLFNGRDVTEKYSFDDIWEYLLKIFLIHKGTFIKVLVLLYRLYYFNDYCCINGKWRYAPSDEICELLNNLETLVLREGFADKFKEYENPTLLQFLLFVNLLSWNEDVKYHAPKGEPYFKNMTESKTGRTNTVLSVISAPLLISKFIEDIISKTQSGGTINVKLITTVIQKFIYSGGTCTLTHKKLYEALAPYLRG